MIELNGKKYIPLQDDTDNYVIIRTQNAGVFAGYLNSFCEKNKVAVLNSARRLWYWNGAATLSQLAMEGVKKPEECKFPCEVEQIKLLGVIEIINCTEQAKKSISDVPVWESKKDD